LKNGYVALVEAVRTAQGTRLACLADVRKESRHEKDKPTLFFR
jgi:hypothetical protein